MANLSPCFRRTFVFFNVLFAIAGIALLVVTVLAHIAVSDRQVENKELGLFFLYLISITICIVSVLGVCGAHKENKCVLITYFVTVCVGTIVLFRIAFLISLYDTQVSDVRQGLNLMTPLNTASKDIQEGFKAFQEQARCCGIFKGYEDWGGDVPASCDCETDHNEPDQCQQVTVRKSRWDYSVTSRVVYSQPCGLLLLHYLEMGRSAGLGIVLSIAVLALLASVMSLGMIIRITSSPPPQRSAPVFPLNYQPPKYSELYKVNNNIIV